MHLNLFNIVSQQHHRQQTEYKQYNTSHEAIQSILKTIEGDSFAEMALQELRIRIYEIIRDDDTPYKCRIYIKKLEFTYCIGKREQCRNDLVININDNCKTYLWLNRDNSWLTRANSFILRMLSNIIK